MTLETKVLIKEAIEVWLTEHPLSQSDFSEKCGVNSSYIINIRKGDFTIKSGSKIIEIADKYFKRIAELIDFETEKSYWKIQSTDQLKVILAELKDAKDNGEIVVIIGETGCGKTTALKLFQKKHPSDFFTVKVGSSDNLGDLLDKTIEVLKIQVHSRSKSKKITAIAKFMKTMSENNGDPVIAYDECEHMKIPALCAMKEFYDLLDKWCSLALVGTPQLLDNLEKLKRRNKPGIPQFYRRVKFKIRLLPKIDRSFKDFLNGIETGLKRWLQANCENYGELHDVLVPAIRDAEKNNQPLTEEFVKMVLGIK